MMKNLSILFIGVLSFVLMTGCNNDDITLNDESLLGELPSFEYLGFVYYIHPHLNTRGNFNYNEINEKVNILDSYGFNSWFIPSFNELKAAAISAGNFSKDLIYLSSSKNGEQYTCLYYSDSSGDWQSSIIENNKVYYWDLTIYPMIKFRR